MNAIECIVYQETQADVTLKYTPMQNGAKPAEQQVSADTFAQLVMLAGSSNHNVAVGAARLLPVFCTTQTQASSPGRLSVYNPIP